MPISSRTKRRVILLCGLLFLAMVIQACQGQVTEPAPPIAPAPTTAVSGIRLQGEVNPTQHAALNKLAAISSKPLEGLARGGQVEFLSLGVKISDAEAPTPQEKALLFLKQNQDLYQYGGYPQNLKLGQKTTDESGNTVVELSQQYQGVPVYGSGFSFFIGSDDTIYTAQAGYVPNLEVDVQPTVRSIHAEQTALGDFNAEDGKLAEATTLQIYEPAVWDSSRAVLNPRLAWFVTVTSDSTLRECLYVIDAHEGSILDRMDMVLEAGGELDLWVLENTKPKLPPDKTVIRISEGITVTYESPNTFSEAAARNVKKIDSYYWEKFGRESYADAVDDFDTPVEVTFTIWEIVTDCAELSNLYNNPALTMAMWLPDKQSLNICGEYSNYPDVIYHEYTHAVMASEVKLQDWGEPRELNEAFSDIFAALASENLDGSRWQINWPEVDDQGKNILRDLENVIQGFTYDYPRTFNERYCDRRLPDWQCLRKCPEKFGLYIETYPDCGHANSLVFSHAAFLMSQNTPSMPGVSLNKLQYIFYEVLTRRLMSNTDLFDAAYSTFAVCDQFVMGRIKNERLKETITLEDCEKVRQAFDMVGLYDYVVVPSLPPSTPVPTLLPTITPTSSDILPTPVPPDESWGDQIGTEIEQFFANLVFQFQTWINTLADQFLNTLKLEFVAFVEELGRKFIELLSQQCCMGTMPLILLPSGWLVGRWRRKSSR